MNFSFFIAIYSLIALQYATMKEFQSNQYGMITVVIGAIFGEGEESSDLYAAYKIATMTLDIPQSEKYSFYFKTVFVEDISNSFQMSGAICQLLVDGAVAIIGPVHRRSMNTIRSLTNHYDILYLTVSDAHIYAGEIEINKRADKIIKLNPTISDLLADFIYDHHWSRMLYIYDSEDALYRLRMLFELTNSHNYELSADVRMIPKDKKSKLITYIDNQSKSHQKKQVVLDLNDPELIQQALCQLKDIINNRLDYHFLFTDIDFLELNHSDLVYGRINVTTFNVIDYSSNLVLEFLAKFWKNSIYKSHFNKTIFKPKSLLHNEMLPTDAALIIDGIAVLKKVIETAEPHHEPTQSSSDEPCTPETVPKWRASNLLPIFHKISHIGLTGNLSFNYSGFRQGFNINIYEARVKSNLIKIGNWTQGKGFQMEEKKSSPISNNIRFENKTRIVTSILVPPFLEKVKEKDGTFTYEGFCYDLIKEIALEVNFTFIIKEVSDGNYGSLVNGTWNGMIGELIDEKADLAVGPLTITSGRERVVDFSTPFQEFGLSVMFLKSHSKDPEIFGFMKPLSSDIWMCIAYAYLGVSVVLFMVSRFNPTEWNENNIVNYEKDNESNIGNEFSIFNSFWFSLSAFMQQGGDVSPRSLSGRIVGGVWWFFTLIIVSSYTANLAAYLTVERMANPIKSYEDLAKQNKIKYGVVESGTSIEFFSKSSIDTFKKMWQFMEANPDVFVNNISSGYKKVINSNREYAFLLESSMNDYYNLQDNCITTKIGPNLDSGKGYGIATPPGSILRDPINLAVIKLKERNRISELVQKWWNNKSPCSQQKESLESSITKNSVKFNDIKGLFLLLLGGIGLGIFLSVLELLYKCALESKRKKKSFIETFKEISENTRQIRKRQDESDISFKSNTNSRVMFAI